MADNARDDAIRTTSVASTAAETDPIVIRESKDQTRRLVFLPLVHDDAENNLRGCFVYQRKARQDEWEDIKGESLGKLKSGEGYVLELHSAEVSTLMEGLLARKDLYEKHGIVYGKQTYFRRENLPEIVRGIIDFPDSELAAALQELGVNDVLSLSHKVDVSKLDALLSEWKDNADNPHEDYWQDLFTRNAWVFSQLTGSPVVVLKAKAYVGGKGIDNKGGGEIDYLLRNELTDNVSFVEIKTPTTPLVAASYRTSGSFSLDKELTGGLVQVLGYKDTFEKEYHALRGDDSTFLSHNPRCYLILGLAANMIDGERRGFELFRCSLAGVQILTFDEVEARVRGIRDALSNSTPDN